MSVSRQQLIGIAHAERQRLGRTIQYAPADAWEQPSACAGWWNRDIVAHLGGQDTAAAHLLLGDPAEEIDAYRASLPSDDAFTVDGLNTYFVNNRSALPYRDVLTTWGSRGGGDARVRVRALRGPMARRAVPLAPGSDRRAIPGAIARRGVVGPRRGHPRHDRARPADPTLAHLPHDRHGGADAALDARGGGHRSPGRERADRSGRRGRGFVALGTRRRRDHRRRTRSPTRSSRVAVPSSRSLRRTASRWTTSSTRATSRSVASPRSPRRSSGTSARTRSARAGTWPTHAARKPVPLPVRRPHEYRAAHASEGARV